MTALEIVGLLGGAGALIVGLSAWLGKIWAGRIAEKERAANEVTLDKLRSELEISRSRITRNEAAQFQLYNEVWQKLQDVKKWGDALWEQARRDNLEQFITALDNAKKVIEKGRVIISENHYAAVKKLLNDFSNYSVGKAKIIELRSSGKLDSFYQSYTEPQIREQIQQNANHKHNYESLLEEIVIAFKARLFLDN